MSVLPAKKRAAAARAKAAPAKAWAKDAPPHDTGEVESFGRYDIENESLFLDLFGDELNRFLKELPEEFRKALLLRDKR